MSIRDDGNLHLALALLLRLPLILIGIVILLGLVPRYLLGLGVVIYQ